MATSVCQVIFLLALVITTCKAQSGGNCVSIKAAFNYQNNIFFVIGSQFIKVDTSLRQRNRRGMNAFAVQGPVNAAMMYRRELYFFQGNRIRIFSFGRQRPRNIPAGRMSPFLAGGIDAAGFSGGSHYFFKGCNYKRGFGGNEGHLYDLGLPCDIDAAWVFKGEMNIAKGDNVWSMNGQGQVTGPKKLSRMLRLTRTTVCRGRESLQAAKKKAEKDYERVNDCVVVDAAIYSFFKLRFFNNDKYITFNMFGNEDGRGSTLNWNGAGPNIDASLAWSGDVFIYYFRGARHYKVVLGISTGPFNNNKWGPFFLTGIDAGSNHNGKSYFFKGCDMIRYSGPLWRANERKKTSDVGLPCNIDAAYSKGGDMYVIKRDQMWKWPASQHRAIGPQPLSSLVRMTSWRACPSTRQ